MTTFKTILYLDDMRTPLARGIDVVRNYDEFVRYLEENGIPELVSFDHDLSDEHYMPESEWGKPLDYSSYKEKTGLDCARYLIENNLPIKRWGVHSMNAVGKRNIENLLRSYCPDGEIPGFNVKTIPYVIFPTE